MTRPRQHLQRCSALAIACLLVITVVSGCGISLQTLPQLGGSNGGYTLHATFSNVQNLAANGQVRLGDAVVGRVTHIAAQGDVAAVTMKIDRGVKLPVGSTAQVRFVAPLGDEYLQLARPAPSANGPMLAAGATIPVGDTTAAPSVADTFAALGTVLYGSGLGQAETVVSQLNLILGGNIPQVRDLLTELNTGVTSLAGNETGIDNALQAVASLSAQLNAGTPAITQALATLPTAATTMSADNAQFDQLLKQVQDLAPATTTLVSQDRQAMVDTIRQLVPVASQLAALQNQIDPDLSVVQRLLKDIPHIAPAGYAQANVLLTGSTSPAGCSINLPSAATGADPSTDPGGACNPNLPQDTPGSDTTAAVNAGFCPQTALDLLPPLGFVLPPYKHLVPVSSPSQGGSNADTIFCRPDSPGPSPSTGTASAGQPATRSAPSANSASGGNQPLRNLLESSLP